MADNIEHQDKGELVTNCDRLQNDEVVVTTPVESRIMSIRGNQIMIDRDLAELYGVETKRLNEAVKRNIERFPERFRFQLTKEEMAELVANCDRFNSLKHSTVRSYAFTEQGVAMLSTVLRSETAIRVSIRIMDAFVAMRRFMVTNAEVFQRLSTIEYHQLEMQQHQQETDKRIDEMFRRLDEGNGHASHLNSEPGRVFCFLWYMATKVTILVEKGKHEPSQKRKQQFLECLHQMANELQTAVI